eukprot:SAG31_NODE_978_length_10615_cov_4.488208_3_plen_1012_part_00
MQIASHLLDRVLDAVRSLPPEPAVDEVRLDALLEEPLNGPMMQFDSTVDSSSALDTRHSKGKRSGYAFAADQLGLADRLQHQRGRTLLVGGDRSEAKTGPDPKSCEHAGNDTAASCLDVDGDLNFQEDRGDHSQWGSCPLCGVRLQLDQLAIHADACANSGMGATSEDVDEPESIEIDPKGRGICPLCNISLPFSRLAAHAASCTGPPDSDDVEIVATLSADERLARHNANVPVVQLSSSDDELCDDTDQPPTSEQLRHSSADLEQGLAAARSAEDGASNSDVATAEDAFEIFDYEAGTMDSQMTAQTDRPIAATKEAPSANFDAIPPVRWRPAAGEVEETAQARITVAMIRNDGTQTTTNLPPAPRQRQNSQITPVECSPRPKAAATRPSRRDELLADSRLWKDSESDDEDTACSRRQRRSSSAASGARTSVQVQASAATTSTPSVEASITAALSPAARASIPKAATAVMPVQAQPAAGDAVARIALTEHSISNPHDHGFDGSGSDIPDSQRHIPGTACTDQMRSLSGQCDSGHDHAISTAPNLPGSSASECWQRKASADLGAKPRQTPRTVPAALLRPAERIHGRLMSRKEAALADRAAFRAGGGKSTAVRLIPRKKDRRRGLPDSSHAVRESGNRPAAAAFAAIDHVLAEAEAAAISADHFVTAASTASASIRSADKFSLDGRQRQLNTDRACSHVSIKRWKGSNQQAAGSTQPPRHQKTPIQFQSGSSQQLLSCVPESLSEQRRVPASQHQQHSSDDETEEELEIVNDEVEEANEDEETFQFEDENAELLKNSDIDWEGINWDKIEADAELVFVDSMTVQAAPNRADNDPSTRCASSTMRSRTSFGGSSDDARTWQGTGLQNGQQQPLTQPVNVVNAGRAQSGDKVISSKRQPPIKPLFRACGGAGCLRPTTRRVETWRGSPLPLQTVTRNGPGSVPAPAKQQPELHVAPKTKAPRRTAVFPPQRHKRSLPAEPVDSAINVKKTKAAAPTRSASGSKSILSFFNKKG